MEISELIQAPLIDLWDRLFLYLPRFLGAMFIFLIGVVLANVLRRVVEQLMNFLRVDQLAQTFEITSQCERFGIHLRIAALFGWMVKWFFIVVSLIVATDILGWDQVTDYLQEIVLFVPNVIVAVIILLSGILLGNFVQRVVKSAVEAAKLQSAGSLAGLAKWAILIFSFMAALVQLHIAPDLIQVLFTGLVFMLSLAGGLAFGLGGKDQAARVLDRLRKDISNQE